jgi:hypothetical protein
MMNQKTTSDQMTVTSKTNFQPTRYNGWANYQTWNVALWMQNSKFLYNTAVACVEYHNANEESPYIKFIRCMDNGDNFSTSDDVRWDSLAVDHDEINEMMFELAQ